MIAGLAETVRSLIGESRTFTAPEPLGRAAIRYFCLAIGEDDPVHLDPDHARRMGHRDVIAPPTLVCETNQYMRGPRDDDGYIGFVWDIPALPTARLTRGGNAYVFDQPVCADDVITATFRLVDVSQRTTSSGREMLVVVNEITYSNQRNERLATNRETLIWQDR